MSDDAYLTLGACASVLGDCAPLELDGLKDQCGGNGDDDEQYTTQMTRVRVRTTNAKTKNPSCAEHLTPATPIPFHLTPPPHTSYYYYT